MATEDIQPVDPTKLNSLLNDLEAESQTRQMPAMVVIGAVRRAMSHNRLDTTK